MKTILMLTDFSINAGYVAQYALALAQKIEANLLVCNIYQAGALEERAVGEHLPICLEEQNSIYDIDAVIAHLTARLDEDDQKEAFRPVITQCSEEGLPGEELAHLMSKYNIQLAVISAHSKHNLNGYFEKDHAWDIVEKANFPVLVIPYQARFEPFKLMAFATVMNYTDITVLESLTGLAKHTNSEILISNIAAQPEEDDDIEKFFNQIPFKITYPKILYHNIKGRDVISSLKHLCSFIDIDLLVIVHRRRNLLQKMFSTSITRKMMSRQEKPLLVFPCATVTESLVVL
ncbi:universal stress protein [Mucilaginibacter antarcticus]|uniref:Universal stress protein n=1 Tax=Mucilaginibacter antarcticus TaxID=1855725 RepID=A0ABW5XN37_9SPHI